MPMDQRMTQAPDWVPLPAAVPIASDALIDSQGTSRMYGDDGADSWTQEKNAATLERPMPIDQPMTPAADWVALPRDALASQQLSALSRVSDLFGEEEIAYWLFGGWAVDFYAGVVTREHDDVDLAVWLTEVPRIMELLEGDGWRHAPLKDEDGGTGYERGSVRLELTYLVRHPSGGIFTPLRRGRGEWAMEALADDVRELHGVRARVIGLTALIRAKSSPRDEPKRLRRTVPSLNSCRGYE